MDNLLPLIIIYTKFLKIKVKKLLNQFFKSSNCKTKKVKIQLLILLKMTSLQILNLFYKIMNIKQI